MSVWNQLVIIQLVSETGPMALFFKESDFVVAVQEAEKVFRAITTRSHSGTSSSLIKQKIKSGWRRAALRRKLLNAIETN